MKSKNTLVVLDFDGFLVNSYHLLKLTFDYFDLNIGDEDRFRHRRKFLKYLGGGKELLRNLVRYSLPKKKRIRRILTDIYLDEGRILQPFVPLINRMIEDPSVHVGLLSRNYTHHPGVTMRTVLRNSGVREEGLDFVIPIPTGTKKHDVLEGMKSARYRNCLFGADEIGDYNAALAAGYDSIVMAGYGFDKKSRLVSVGKVPEELIFDTPETAAGELAACIAAVQTPEQPVHKMDARRRIFPWSGTTEPQTLPFLA